MIIKMRDNTPAWALAATAPLRTRLAGLPMVPAQLRRWVPPYIACVVLILFTLNMDLFRSSQAHQRNAIPMAMPGVYGGADGQIDAPRLKSEFPKKIWQTWKVHPLAFDEREIETGRTWLGKNPDFRYEVLTDWNDVEYVRYHYGPEGLNRPDIVSFYESVSAAIVKADLLRYLIIYAEGGVYTDVDVDALKGVRKWIPERFHTKDLDMVVGIEIDEPDWADHPILGPKSRSFCQWTFMAKPHVPVMLHLVEHIMKWLSGVAKNQGVPVSQVDLDFDEIISGTGPSAFTNAIIDEMNKHRPADNPVTWDEFHDMQEAKVISRFLVLTVEAFAAGQGHSNSGTHEARAALVQHHYHASNWPSKHHRYNHPVYGEVEICNWEDECVKEWDKNVAAFKALSAEEQQKMIEDKEREKQEQEEEEFRQWEEEERRRKEEEEAQRRRQEEEEKNRKEDEERRRKEAAASKVNKESEIEAESERRKQEEQQHQHQQQIVHHVKEKMPGSSEDADAGDDEAAASDDADEVSAALH